MTGDKKKVVAWLLDQPDGRLYDIEIHREKRSLNANAYAWALIGKIADALRTDKDAVYLQMLERYGQSDVVTVREDVPWQRIFKYAEEIGKGVVRGRVFRHVRVYRGSSEYDSREMAVLIDGIIDEAKGLGIETLPPDEVARMKERWKG